MVREFIYNLSGRELKVTIGKVAEQANGSCLVQCGETVVLVNACASKEPREGVDFFPLSCDFEEKLYSVGKIPGGFIKREGRPTDEATLAARMIDRPMRPLFPEDFRNSVQIVNTVLSVEQDCDPRLAATFGSSLAVSLSKIPFNGPIASVVVGKVDNRLIINPTVEEQNKSVLYLTVAGTKEAINMVESSAKELQEDEMIEALMFGHEAIKELIKFEEKIIKELAVDKMEYEKLIITEDIVKKVDEVKDELDKALRIKEKQEKYDAISSIEEKLVEYVKETNKNVKEEELNELIVKYKNTFNNLEYELFRNIVVKEKKRPDGRKMDEIRDLSASVDFLPRTHGSALFTRGETQSLSITTLGALNEYQILDGLSEEEGKRFILHYNFPQFSVGETGRYGAPGRREIGHGALGEKALLQVIPSEEEFPYTIRVVSEILESNGSSSQASICAGCMSLMAAGVPIKDMVAGIAMGLITSGDDYTVLTDIQGMEDHLGDMDFKVAGTKNGICALQMDIKIKGITKEILTEALNEAKKARIKILKVMKSAISEPRKELSEYAPKMVTFNIKPEKIKEVIGKGGETITKIIQEASGVISVNDVKAVKIDIDDFGKVIIYHKDKKIIDKTKAMIDNIVKELEFGKVYPAVIKEIKDFGCIVEFWEGMEGLVHISKLSKERIENIKDKFSVGDKVDVEVLGLDKKGKIDLRVKEKEKNPIKKIMEKIIKND